MYLLWYNVSMSKRIILKRVPAKFFRSASGNEPVREWLKSMTKEDARRIGEDIKTVEFGWPVGMPVCRPLTGYKDVWEVRSSITHGIARVLFYIKDGQMVLLHGFIKKTQKTPASDREIAIKRKKEYERYG